MFRTFHKYLSLAISVQLLLWTISGIYFAFNKIELIRGEQYLVDEEVTSLDLENLKGTFNVKNVNILQRLNKWIVRVEGESKTYYKDLNGYELPLNAALTLELDFNVLLHSTHDRLEGINSFLEKRTPDFQGS